MLRRYFAANSTIVLILLAMIPGVVSAQESDLRPLFQLLGSDAPYSFPERAVVGPSGNIYVLDTRLSNIFFLDFRQSRVTALCGPGALGPVSDMTVDSKENIWVLDGRSPRITKLDRQCAVQTQFISHRLPLRIGANSFGEVIVLTGEGESLFDIFSADGKLLRSFGKRIEYNSAGATAELSDGHIVPDKSGGFYFSFNYPPLIQHYGRTGRLLQEFRPESNINIGPAHVSARRQGSAIAVTSQYQILVLDMAVDRRGKLYLLMSGKNKFQALNEGSSTLAVVANAGHTLKTVSLQSNFHRLMVGDNNLYLLRNREPLMLDAYPIP